MEVAMNKYKKLCENCKVVMDISPQVLHLEEVYVGIKEPLLVTYIECPTCGEKSLAQLDTIETKYLGSKVGKLHLLRSQGKLSKTQKLRLQQLDKQLCNKRANLKQYRGQVNQLICE